MNGYIHCACRDCFEITIGGPGTFCWQCVKHGCHDYQGIGGMSQECQRPDAYGDLDCPKCKQSDEVFYDESENGEGQWRCERCGSNDNVNTN